MSVDIEKQAGYVELISNCSGLSKTESTKLFNTIKEAIVARLRQGNPVTVFGLGVLSVKTRAARVGRNPKTGEPLQIAAANVPGFKAGKALKEAVNSGSVVG